MNDLFMKKNKIVEYIMNIQNCMMTESPPTTSVEVACIIIHNPTKLQLSIMR